MDHGRPGAPVARREHQAGLGRCGHEPPRRQQRRARVDVQVTGDAIGEPGRRQVADVDAEEPLHIAGFLARLGLGVGLGVAEDRHRVVATGARGQPPRIVAERRARAGDVRGVVRISEKLADVEHEQGIVALGEVPAHREQCAAGPGRSKVVPLEGGSAGQICLGQRRAVHGVDQLDHEAPPRACDQLAPVALDERGGHRPTPIAELGGDRTSPQVAQLDLGAARGDDQGMAVRWRQRQLADRPRRSPAPALVSLTADQPQVQDRAVGLRGQHVVARHGQSDGRHDAERQANGGQRAGD